MTAALLWARANLRSQWRSAVLVGVVGGRLLWRASANSVDSVYAPGSPWLALVFVAVGLVVVSVGSGEALSHRAVPHSIAPLLRSE